MWWSERQLNCAIRIVTSRTDLSVDQMVIRGHVKSEAGIDGADLSERRHHLRIVGAHVQLRRLEKILDQHLVLGAIVREMNAAERTGGPV